MSAIHLDHLSFSYSSAVEVFDDASVHLGPGWTGVVGANGAGKSTLLSLIAGNLSPTAGRLILDPPVASVARCRQEVDEPTNHLDLPSVERIEAALEAYPGALVVVTHDDAFAIRTAETVWRLNLGVLTIGEGPAPVVR